MNNEDDMSVMLLMIMIVNNDAHANYEDDMQAMQLMGPEGMVRGSGVERNYRDARLKTTLDHNLNDNETYKESKI